MTRTQHLLPLILIIGFMAGTLVDCVSIGDKTVPVWKAKETADKAIIDAADPESDAFKHAVKVEAKKVADEMLANTPKFLWIPYVGGGVIILLGALCIGFWDKRKGIVLMLAGGLCVVFGVIVQTMVIWLERFLPWVGLGLVVAIIGAVVYIIVWNRGLIKRLIKSVDVVKKQKEWNSQSKEEVDKVQGARKTMIGKIRGKK